MGVRGRRPKPTQLKVISGNPGKRPLNLSEPKPEGPAQCPAWLDGGGKAEWRRVAPHLEKMGLLTAVDMAAFACYCDAVSKLEQANNKIESLGLIAKTGGGGAKVSPYFTIRSKAMEEIRAFASEFGFTPSSRGRIEMPPEVPEDEESKFFFGD